MCPASIVVRVSAPMPSPATPPPRPPCSAPLSSSGAEGVGERHLRLKIVVAEFNAGWIAHWLGRVDQGLQRERRIMAEPFTGTSPHEVWRRQFSATIEDARPALVTREFIGIDNLMWGSDYPHTDSTWPCSNEVLDELFDGITDEERAKITRGNVKPLYGV